MNRSYSYINTATKLVNLFDGEKPFNAFLKQFFAANKKYGSRDRRQIAALCYNYFRLGFAAHHLPLEERLLLGVFLFEEQSSEILEKLKPEWNARVALPLKKKLVLVKKLFAITDLFPFQNELSKGVDIEAFCQSFLIQPAVFFRIRPQNRTTSLRKLEKVKIPYKFVNDECIQMQAGTNVQDFFIINKEVVIQDYNSQQVLNYLKNEAVQKKLYSHAKKPLFSAWDCCAASGGKSILLMDIFYKKIELTVSDIRASIVLNLHQRFKKAGIKEYKYFISDVGTADFTPVSSDFDLVICDAPCTGSGTWSRTPEALCYFKEENIAGYQTLQKEIVSHVLPHLKKGGLFIYITCSVFQKENEAVSEFIIEKRKYKLIEQHLLKGYNLKADSMFVAVFEKL